MTQEVFESIIDTRFLHNEHRGASKYPLLGVDWLTVFITDRPIMMQVLPAFMHRNDFTEKTTIVPGEYDISRWTRPVETVFEIRSNKEKIVIKKGDAILYVKFSSDDSIKLVESNTPWKEISTCNDITNTNRLKSLKERYASLAAARIDKCPYDQKNNSSNPTV
jgi:hypothetical protein